jgi:spore coat polysaccharide biosynthesis protein SpsF
MTLAIIQARMTSTRLPGKVLADLNGQPLLGYMIERVRRAKALDHIVVATSDQPTDDPVAALCANIGIDVVRGSEHNVLDRFHQAAEQYSDSTIVRLTADCPMLDPGILDNVVAKYACGDWDYLSNTIQRTFPDGLDVEVFSAQALARAWKEATKEYEQEHVTPYIHNNGAPAETGFKVGHDIFCADFGHLRWTVDTQEDLDRVRQLDRRLGKSYTWLDALAEATKQPDLLGSQA